MAQTGTWIRTYRLFVPKIRFQARPPIAGKCTTLHEPMVKLNANRTVVGTLRGFDQFMNLVIDNTVEVNGNERNEIGMVVIRGNSVVTVEALEPINKSYTLSLHCLTVAVADVPFSR
ncbi:hypothetical protein V2J09_010692 [Rumex salicifolius]